MARCYNDASLQLDLSEGGNGIGMEEEKKKDMNGNRSSSSRL